MMAKSLIHEGMAVIRTLKATPQMLPVSAVYTKAEDKCQEWVPSSHCGPELELRLAAGAASVLAH